MASGVSAVTSGGPPTPRTVIAAMIYGTLASLIERALAARRTQEPQEPGEKRLAPRHLPRR